MRITLESTPEIVNLDGRRCRVWRGRNSAGVPVVAYIAALRVDAADPCGQFERELLERREPTLAPARPERVLRILAPATPKLPGVDGER